MTRAVFVTHEPLADAMAGTAIRVYEMARSLVRAASITIATPYPISRPLPEGVDARQYRFGDQESLVELCRDRDVLLVQGFTLYKFPALAELDAAIVVDLYCPFQWENLERMRWVDASDAEAAHAAQVDRDVLAQQLRRGDFFLCANERQRDLWLGMLYALGRVDARSYRQDQTAERLVGIVPFGIPETPPARSGAAFRGVIPGIGPEDRLIVWGGSVLQWHDPVTLVEAMRGVAAAVPNARLVLPAGAHPNPELPPVPALDAARSTARQLDLVDRHVFFGPWVPYDRRADYLLEADLGVSTHQPSLETRFAWRTRMLDYVWATLPIVCTEGDAFADIVERRGLGSTVPPLRPGPLAEAIVALLTDPDRAEECRAAEMQLRDELRWSRAVEPLRQFLAAPTRHPSSRTLSAADPLRPDAGGQPSTPRRARALAARGLRRVRRWLGATS